MTATPTDEPNAVRIDIGCPCHYSDLGCRGAIQITLPIRIFDLKGEFEYRQILQKFLADNVKIFDEFYERVRKDLMSKDPLVIRPERKGRITAFIDTSDLTTGTDEQSTNEC